MSMVSAHVYKKIGAHTKGFTLVELLVAVSILSISILSVFTAVSNNMKGQGFSEDQIVAYHLADEGIEYIRNVRDYNGIYNTYAIGSGGSSISWLTGISALCGTACTVDSPHPGSAPDISACSGTCPVLLMDPVNGFYGYTSGWTTTPYTRTVTVTTPNANEAVVTVTVSWTANGVSKNYVLSEVMSNWQ